MKKKIQLSIILLFTSFGFSYAQYNVLSNNGDAVEIKPNSFVVKRSNYNGSNIGIGINSHKSLTNLVGNFQNYAFGYLANASQPTGSENVAIGVGARGNSTAGNANIAIGFASLIGNNGFLNIAAGPLAAGISGNSVNKIAIGHLAGYSDSTSNSIAIGSQSKLFNNLNSTNTALFIGFQSGYQLAKNNSNVAIGSRAMSKGNNSTLNVAIGHEAIQYSTIGTSGNIAVGFQAMGVKSFTGTFGPYNNIAIGKKAMLNDTASTSSIGIGTSALISMKKGYGNIAIGDEAFRFLREGFDNIGIGRRAGGVDQFAFGSSIVYYGLSSGDNNIIVGYNSGKGMTSNNDGNVILGSQALSNASTNIQINSMLGYKAGEGLTTGSYNTFIGSNAKTTNNSISFATAIGYDVENNTSNTIVLGNSSVTSIGGYAAFSNFSDRRLKSNIKYTSDLGLGLINKLRTTKYFYITDPNRKLRQGLIAQELEKVLIDENLPFSGLIKLEDQDKTYQIAYETLTIPLINSTIELENRLSELEESFKFHDKTNIEFYSSMLNNIKK